MKRWFLLFLMLISCRTNTFGEGVGKPPFPLLGPKTLVISEVFVPSVEVNNLGEAIIEQPLSLCTSQTCISVTLNAQSLERVVFSVDGLDLSANAGELALLKEDTLLDYVVWGASSAALHSTVNALAQNQARGFVELPYPLPTTVAVAFESEGESCAAPSLGAKATLSECPTVSTTPLKLGVLAANTIELINQTTETLRLDGVHLCYANVCDAFAFGSEILPSATAVVNLGTTVDGQLNLPNAAELPTSGTINLCAPGSLSTCDTVLDTKVF